MTSCSIYRNNLFTLRTYMNNKTKTALMLLVLFSTPTKPAIKIVLSAALTDAFFEFRKAQYLESFSILKEYGYEDFYIIEALKKKGPTFLDAYSSRVFYAQTNDPSFRNNGVNEAKTLLEGIKHFQFDDDDMIVKFTGRYQLTSDYFLKLVESHQEYDALVKVNSEGNVFTLGFAMKCKHFIEMFEQMNFSAMGNIMRPIEYDVGDYIKAKVAQGNFTVYYVSEVHIKVNIYGSSNAPNAPAVMHYH